MVVKFLIDECLSPSLALLAREQGYVESSHVTWIGKGGWKDWELMKFVLANDWTFVTRNSVDFRGSPESPGSEGQYSDATLHAGLVCINGPISMNAQTESALFLVVLDALQGEQMLNEAIEVTLAAEDQEFELLRYALPDSTNSA